MNNARLEAQRANSTSKCANCGWWKGGETPAGTCERHGIKTLDLAVCSDWRDADVVADVLRPEEELPDDVPRWVSE